MRLEGIDEGKPFDWGKASEDYAKYRDIYPPAFYEAITQMGIGLQGQQVLDLGTGTGVLPRHLAEQGAHFTGVDISPQQIEQAKRLSKAAGLCIHYLVCPAEEIDFAENSFDAVTACQCFFYFDHAVLLPKLYRMLKPGGRLGIFYMAWLPCESEIAAESEKLILRYNPNWSGRGEVRKPLAVPPEAEGLFVKEESKILDFSIPFTRKSWNGRIKACRGIGASLSPEQVSRFEKEHLSLLDKIAPESFAIPHYAAMLILRAC